MAVSMSRGEMEALAARCETAGEGARALDWDIAVALGEVPEHRVIERGWDYVWYRHPDDYALWRAKDSEGRDVELWQPVARTASLDAAMGLVPDGHTWSIDTMDGPIVACVWGYGPVPDAAYRRAATPALALCAASLRARAAMEPHHD